MTKSLSELQNYLEQEKKFINSTSLELIKARRTAFIARFIVLRESKRSRAHGEIELLKWKEETTAEELVAIIANIFQSNNENMKSVTRDLERALSHASRSMSHFVAEYVKRSTNSFVEALNDYNRSNVLLFGDDVDESLHGWSSPTRISERLLKRSKQQL